MVKMPDYPKELKAAEWEKNRGKATKLKSETGLGVELKKAEADYDRVVKAHHDNQIAMCNTSSQVTKIATVCLDPLIVLLAVDTPRSFGQALLEYSEKAGDSEVRKLVDLWGKLGVTAINTLEDASRFISDVADAYKTTLPVLKKKGFRV